MIKYETKKLGERRKFPYLEISFGNFRFMIYKLRKKLTIRCEFSRGWDK